MPIYQYQCAECGHQMEALQRMNDPKLTDCPECKAPALKKQLTAAAFKLKGTGWYETDFKNSGKKPNTQKGSGDSESPNKGSNEKTKDSKSDTPKKTASAE